MKPAFRRIVAAAQAFALTSALSACMVVGGDTLAVPGGAEDFPNTVTPLGRLAVVDFSSAGGWEQIPLVAPEMPPLPSLASLQLAPPAARFAAGGKASALGKSAADTLDMSLWQVDTMPTRAFEAYFYGRFYAYAYDSSATEVRRDTVMALYLGDMSQVSFSSLRAVRDSIVGNPGKFLLPLDYRGAVRHVASGVLQSYRLRNLDSEGAMDLAEYATLAPEADGGTSRKWVRIYGPEGAYALPQAVPEEYELLRRGPAGDTLSWTHVKDADWDRKLWSTQGGGVVDLYLRVRNPEAQPSALRIHSYVRGEYAPSSAGDSLRQLSYQEQRWLRDGRNVTFTFQGVGTAGGVLLGNDTARMTVDTVFALRDSMIKYSAAYKMLLGPVPGRMQDHKLVGFSVQKAWRSGALFSNASYFLPAAPVPMGQSGFTGLMSTTSVYRNGDSVVTAGSIDSAGFSLRVETVRAGVRSGYDVLLNAAGELIRHTVAPDATAAPRRGAAGLP